MGKYEEVWKMWGRCVKVCLGCGKMCLGMGNVLGLGECKVGGGARKCGEQCVRVGGRCVGVEEEVKERSGGGEKMWERCEKVYWGVGEEV